MLCMLKSCSKCRGDLVLDGDEWKCMQCARYYYGDTNGTSGESHLLLPSAHAWRPTFEPAPTPAAADIPHSVSEGKSYRRRRRKGLVARSTRNINSVIQAKITSETRWWERNRQIIGYLDQGLSVREISMLTQHGQRQIRTVRGKLVDLRELAQVEA